MRSALALLAAATVAFVAAVRSAAQPAATNPHDLSGTWQLNTWLTDPSDEISQELRTDLGPPEQHDVFAAPEGGGMREPMGRRGPVRGRGIAPVPPQPRLNSDEQKRIQGLLDVVRIPAVTLTITESADSVTMADPVHGSRTFHTSGAKEKQSFGATAIESTTRWEGPQLITDYDVGHGIALRFSYMLAPPNNVLLVRVSAMLPGSEAAPFTIRHVYDKQAAK